MVRAVPIKWENYGGKWVAYPAPHKPLPYYDYYKKLEWTPEVERQLKDLDSNLTPYGVCWTPSSIKEKQAKFERKLLRSSVMPLPLMLLVYLWCLTTKDGEAHGLGFVLGCAGIQVFRLFMIKLENESDRKASLIALRELFRLTALGRTEACDIIYPPYQRLDYCCPYHEEIKEERLAAIEKYETLLFFGRTTIQGFDIKENEGLDMDAVVKFKKNFEKKWKSLPEQEKTSRYREQLEFQWEDLSEWKIGNKPEMAKANGKGAN